MPERFLPPGPRAMVRGSWLVVYVGIALAAFLMLRYQPDSLEDGLGARVAFAACSAGAVVASVAALALVSYRWRIEWVASAMTLGAVATYCGLEWWLVGSLGGSHSGSAVILTVVCASLLARIGALWALHIETLHWRGVRAA